MRSDPAYSNDFVATVAKTSWPQGAVGAERGRGGRPSNLGPDDVAISHHTKRLRPLFAPVAAISLAACHRSGVLDPQGPVARAETLILIDATAIMLAVIVPVIAVTLAFAWWYRRGNAHARRRSDFAYSGPIEMVVWSIPLLIILFLGGIAWTSSHELDTARPLKSDRPPVNVEVVSLDWKWLFIYPDQGVATVNRLVIPAGTPIRLRLTSSGVMNSFLVPQLGSQIYTMAGMTTELNLLADRPGQYKGFSAQFSGAGFSDMRFIVETVPPDRFGGWVAALRPHGGLLDIPAYRALARPALSATGYYGSVAPSLFDVIIADGTQWRCHTQAPSATKGSAVAC
jgi:cytochrome o ubiquinol oxidase subunit 2